MDVALNNPQKLICHKTQPNQTKPNQTKPEVFHQTILSGIVSKQHQAFQRVVPKYHFFCLRNKSMRRRFADGEGGMFKYVPMPWIEGGL